MLLLDGCCGLTTEPSHHEGRDARHGQHSGGGTRASAGADIKRREFIASLITSNSSEEALRLGPTRAIYIIYDIRRFRGRLINQVYWGLIIGLTQCCSNGPPKEFRAYMLNPRCKTVVYTTAHSLSETYLWNPKQQGLL